MRNNSHRLLVQQLPCLAYSYVRKRISYQMFFCAHRCVVHTRYIRSCMYKICCTRTKLIPYSMYTEAVRVLNIININSWSTTLCT